MSLHTTTAAPRKGTAVQESSRLQAADASSVPRATDREQLCEQGYCLVVTTTTTRGSRRRLYVSVSAAEAAVHRAHVRGGVADVGLFQLVPVTGGTW